MVTAWQQTMPWHSGWGSKPTWNGSHIKFKHIESHYWHLSHPVNGGIHHHTVTTKLVGPELGSQLRSVLLALCPQMMPWCSGWGSYPTWNVSHIHSKYIQSDWQPTYAVDESMEESSYCYYQTCWPRFGKTIETVSLVCAQMMPWHSNWRWLPTFICCGWEYGSMIMPFLPHLLAQICEVSWDLCHWWCAHKWWYGTVVEALHPHGMAPISTQTHKMWLTTFICCGWVYGSVIVPLSPHLLAQIWEVSLQMMPRWVVEALNPHGMVPTSTPNLYKVIDNLQMLWIVIWICHHAITTTHLLVQTWEVSAEICITGGVHTNDDMAQWLRLKTHMEWLPCQLKHIQYGWQPLYALEGCMDPSSCHYHHTCWPRFGKSSSKLGVTTIKKLLVK